MVTETGQLTVNRNCSVAIGNQNAGLTVLSQPVRIYTANEHDLFAFPLYRKAWCHSLQLMYDVFSTVIQQKELYIMIMLYVAVVFSVIIRISLWFSQAFPESKFLLVTCCESTVN